MNARKKFIIYLVTYAWIMSAIYGIAVEIFIKKLPEQNPYVVVAIGAVVFAIIMAVGIRIIKKQTGYGPNMNKSQ